MSADRYSSSIAWPKMDGLSSKKKADQMDGFAFMSWEVYQGSPFGREDAASENRLKNAFRLEQRRCQNS